MSSTRIRRHVKAPRECVAASKLVPNEQVVEVVEFETADLSLRGEMTLQWTDPGVWGGGDSKRRLTHRAVASWAP